MQMETSDGGVLNLSDYPVHSFVASFVALTRRFGFFIGDVGSECFVEPEQLPSSWLIAYASAANLPCAHDLVARGRHPDSMDFNYARKTIIDQLKALTLNQGITSYRVPHHYISVK
ncbi:hypothetical protein WH87_06785 [Devosia epidermidihirudinis]|uniref:Uncharacterized protein n=1 Tax=Devosia epidermidihirudinis TaxID=1293439 RepID=A0A0F5QFU1_9HYPH|nr:hypothetical protein [Devosia epidermidihirudinis]KKC39820.1 hypothetical protein WH87_06785 [Devosia epidermidihirudinis]